MSNENGNGSNNGKGMKIVSLTAENVKRLKAVTITPDGDVEIVGGNNANGKTSVLDSIAMALGGGKMIPAEPIRRGQKKARIEVDLGDLKVERRFTSKGSILEVSSKEGLKYPSPQKILDALVGNLSFDPLAFVTMKPADQLKTLKELVGISFDDLEIERQKLYSARTDINKEVKQLEGQLEGIPEHSDIPESPLSVDQLLAELDAAEKHNRQAEEIERRFEQIDSEHARLEKEIAELRARAVAMQQQQKALIAERGGLTIPEKIEVAGIKERLANAEQINAKVRDAEARKVVAKAMRAKSSESTKLALAIEKIDEQKAERLAAVNFPVPGLSFSEEGVLLNDLPFDQASSAEQLRTSFAIGIAKNPKLKVSLIRDGSLLDENGLKAIAEMAQQHGAQVWIERVGKGAECSVIIEDGMIEGEAVNV